VLISIQSTTLIISSSKLSQILEGSSIKVHHKSEDSALVSRERFFNIAYSNIVIAAKSL